MFDHQENHYGRIMFIYMFIYMFIFMFIYVKKNYISIISAEWIRAKYPIITTRW